jgi:predicted nucleotidyltransferase
LINDKAFLYGSYARNEENENSDIDLLLVSSKINESDDYQIGKLWALTCKVNSRIEPYLVSSYKFQNDDISPIIQLVKQEGIEIRDS